MKPGLSLRMSQHLALTPQLQQSIRLLQLSTLDLAAEVEQMLDDNPFLERSSEDAPQSEGDGEGDDAIYSIANSAGSIRTTGQNDAESESGSAVGATELSELADFADWDGDGSSDMAPDDAEWGGDAPARQQPNNGSDSEAEAADLAHEHQSLPQFLHHQALALRLSELDRAALHFLIESLSDDGYLTDTLPELAEALLRNTESEDSKASEAYEELIHRFTVALRLLHSLEPVGVGARDLAECLTLQLRALQNDPATCDATVRTALCACQQPLEGLARRAEQLVVDGNIARHLRGIANHQLRDLAERRVGGAAARVGRHDAAERSQLDLRAAGGKKIRRVVVVFVLGAGQQRHGADRQLAQLATGGQLGAHGFQVHVPAARQRPAPQQGAVEVDEVAAPPRADGGHQFVGLRLGVGGPIGDAHAGLLARG